MSEDAAAALLCGFWAEGDGLTGLAWWLGGEEGGVAGRELGSGEVSVWAGARLTDEGGGVSLRFEEEDGVEATLSPRSAPAPLPSPSGGPAAGHPAATLCDASVSADGEGTARRGLGLVVRWQEDPGTGSGLFRAVTLPAPSDEVVLLTARREAGDANHADEATLAWLLRGDGSATPYEEALLSTQYDADELQTRLGLELWPADGAAPPLRGAATTFALTRSGGVSAALMSSSVEGAEGRGAYLIRRG